MIEIQMDNGVVFYVGKVIAMKDHALPALGLVFSFNSRFELKYNHNKISTYGAVIPPHLNHQLRSFDEKCYFIFVNPEFKLAKDLIHFFNIKQDEILPLERINIPIKYQEILDYSFFDKAFGFKFNDRLIYEVDYRVLEASQFIKRNLIEKNISLKEVADYVHLSESRLAHLFKEQIDMPFRKYVLLSRVKQAVRSIISGSNLTMAAHEAGFSDSAHFSRTCSAMFGTSPSQLFKY